MSLNKTLPLILLVLLVTACTSTPDFDTSGVELSVTPNQALTDLAGNKGRMVLWGGTILSTQNLKNNTQLEILAYPLTTSYQPVTEKKPLGRFIVQHSGYLEPAIYSQGRFITVLGEISGRQNGKIGESQYTYPVIIDKQHHLWSPDELRSRTTFHFGIGIEL